MTRRLILGTAGHIDHGKTALVKRLTGVDTDRLKEEKERGITVDLGFAELITPEGLHFGVVDVPGHEGFVRNMLAGATGMDLVLMVVAADEGVMPQTREHLAIVTLLGVPRILVALTKSDLVEEEWLELVAEEVREALLETPYAKAPILSVSATTGQGVEELLAALDTLGAQAPDRGMKDHPRLPIDRVFTIRGAGTVVTGTLWSGTLHTGDRVKILPGGMEARVRSLQLHGAEARESAPGARVAVGITGDGVHHTAIARGQSLVGGEGWEASRMLTARLAVLPGTGWELEQGQRVRVHLGTAEVLARVALLDSERLGAGEEGWVQLRLEEPVLARGRDRFVIRSYSPVTTMGGGRVAEVLPRKRKRLKKGASPLLDARLSGTVEESLAALLETRSWEGTREEALHHRLGVAPEALADPVQREVAREAVVRIENRLFSPGVLSHGRSLLLQALSDFHRGAPLQSGMPLEELRQVLPPPAPPSLREWIIRRMASEGGIRVARGLARSASFQAELSPAQEALRQRIRERLARAGLAPPSVSELAEELEVEGGALEEILRFMEGEGEVLGLEKGLFFFVPALVEGGERVVARFGGQEGLGPADLREALGVTRKYLLPILRHMDTEGITTRLREDRSVATSLPPGWGTTKRNAQ